MSKVFTSLFKARHLLILLTVIILQGASFNQVSGKEINGIYLVEKVGDTCVQFLSRYPEIRNQSGLMGEQVSVNVISNEPSHTKDMNIGWVLCIILLMAVGGIAAMFFSKLRKMQFEIRKSSLIEEKRDRDFEIICQSLQNEKYFIAVDLQKKLGEIMPLIKENIVGIAKFQEDDADKEEMLAAKSINLVNDAAQKIRAISYKLLAEKSPID